MGTKSNGVDIIATTGTGLAKVINTGFNLIPGRFAVLVQCIRVYAITGRNC